MAPVGLALPRTSRLIVNERAPVVRRVLGSAAGALFLAQQSDVGLSQKTVRAVRSVRFSALVASKIAISPAKAVAPLPLL